MKKPKQIRGSGGGGGGGSSHTPVQFPDNLQSSASAQICDLLGEGEIEGLVNGLKSVYLNETPLQNADGTYNFQGVAINTRNGSQDQTFLPIGRPAQIDNADFDGFNDVENEINVGTFVTHVTPITRSISNPNVTAARVLISFPQLSFQDSSTGDLSGTEVEIKIYVQSNGGGFVQQAHDVINGKSMSKYQKSYRLTLQGGAPYDIRVERVTADATDDVNTQNKTFWDSYTEIVEAKLTYPNSALVALRVKASQFSSIPQRAYDVKLLRIKVPTNYNPETRAYDGIWDGTFKVAWTDNPAWVFYDMLTTARYGLGNFITEDQVDKWTLYQIAKYCDELVPDGFGGMEPRFTCNIYIQTRAEAFKVINDLASIFRGMPFWSSGSITVAQDSPQDASYLFTPANVVDGLFNYIGVSAKSRHTVALVAWNDPDDFCRQKIEYVEDAEGIAQFGVIETQVVAMGCTSRGQAHRLGRWALYTEKYQSETVSFQTGLEAAICQPGQIIKIADPVRAGIRCGGRIVSSDISSIVADGDIPLSISNSLMLSVMLPDGTTEERPVAGIEGREISVTGEFSQAPQAQGIWILSNANVEPQYFRVISVAESKSGVFDVTAIAHNPDKFQAVDQGTVLETRSISLLSDVPDSPTDLQVIETLYAVGKDVRAKITVTWKMVDHAASYVVNWKRDNQNTIMVPETTANDVEILAAEPGQYQFWVYAVSAVGKRSVAAQISKKIQGKIAPPASVQNFSLIPQAGMAYLSWDQSVDLDVLVGGFVRIRYSPDIETPVWKDSVDITEALPGITTKAVVPLLPGAYMAKFIDSSNVPSNEESIIITTIPTALNLNVIETITESPAFAGEKTAMEYREDFDGLTLASTFLIDDIGPIDEIAAIDFLGGVNSEGEYLFANGLDLGGVYSSRLTANIAASAIDVTDTIDQRFDNCDDWLDLDGDFIDDVNAVVYLRSTLDDPEADPTWTEWKPFFVGEYTARAFQFKVIARSNNAAHSIVINSLSVVIDMEDRTENLAGLTSPASVYTVTFAAPFKAAPAVGITAHDMISGDYYVISNKTNSGFDITFKNQAGDAVARTFDVLAKGYGRAS